MKNLITKENALILGVGVVAFFGIKYLMNNKSTTPALSSSFGGNYNDNNYTPPTSDTQGMCGDIPFTDCLSLGYTSCAECNRAVNNISDEQYEGFSGDCGCGG